MRMRLRMAASTGVRMHNSARGFGEWDIKSVFGMVHIELGRGETLECRTFRRELLPRYCPKCAKRVNRAG